MEVLTPGTDDERLRALPELTFDLGWRGEHEFEVSDGFIPIGRPCTCGTWSITPSLDLTEPTMIHPVGTGVTQLNAGECQKLARTPQPPKLTQLS